MCLIGFLHLKNKSFFFFFLLLLYTNYHLFSTATIAHINCGTSVSAHCGLERRRWDNNKGNGSYGKSCSLNSLLGWRMSTKERNKKNNFAGNFECLSLGSVLCLYNIVWTLLIGAITSQSYLHGPSRNWLTIYFRIALLLKPIGVPSLGSLVLFRSPGDIQVSHGWMGFRPFLE